VSPRPACGLPGSPERLLGSGTGVCLCRCVGVSRCCSSGDGGAGRKGRGVISARPLRSRAPRKHLFSSGHDALRTNQSDAPFSDWSAPPPRGATPGRGRWPEPRKVMRQSAKNRHYRTALTLRASREGRLSCRPACGLPGIAGLRTCSKVKLTAKMPRTPR